MLTLNQRKSSHKSLIDNIQIKIIRIRVKLSGINKIIKAVNYF